MQVIIEFCAGCGALAANPGLCVNCGEDVTPRENRCSGTFSREDAKRMFEMYGYELEVPLGGSQ